jgi:hypothetical protein
LVAQVNDVLAGHAQPRRGLASAQQLLASVGGQAFGNGPSHGNYANA